jgi:hypothetical protein
MALCIDGGYVVSGAHPLTTDPTDHSAANLPVVGCNNLRCSRCGATVRSAPGVGRKLKNTTPAEIYEAKDLATAPDIVATLPELRFYVCRCTAFLENGWRRMEEHDVDLKDAIDLPWRCAGHPAPALPHVFDGVAVEKVEDLPALVDKLAGGFIPDGAPSEFRKGAAWLARLYFWLEEGQQAIVRRVVALLDDPAPRKRAYALSFLDRARPAEGKLRVLEILEGDRAGFAGVRDELTRHYGEHTLEDSLWRVAHDSVGRVERARLLARKEALAPGKGGRALYDALAQSDSDWLIENAPSIVRANPAAADQLLEAADAGFPNLDAYNRLVARIKGTATA